MQDDIRFVSCALARDGHGVVTTQAVRFESHGEIFHACQACWRKTTQMIDTSVIWVVDMSTFMTLGTRWVQPGQLIPEDFAYEPWHSTLLMLERLWKEWPAQHSLVAAVGGPGSDAIIQPHVTPPDSIRNLRDHGPAGWYEPRIAFQHALDLATSHPGHEEIFVINRGPAMDRDSETFRNFAGDAVQAGARVHAIPMGNEPGLRLRFPHLAALEEMVLVGQGNLYWEPNFEDTHDFSMLPTSIVDRILEDFQ